MDREGRSLARSVGARARSAVSPRERGERKDAEEEKKAAVVTIGSSPFARLLVPRGHQSQTSPHWLSLLGLRSLVRSFPCPVENEAESEMFNISESRAPPDAKVEIPL